MKTLSYFVITSILCVPHIWCQSVTKTPICENDMANVIFKEAFRWKTFLYAFTEDDTIYKVSGFKWNRDTLQFSYNTSEVVTEPRWNVGDLRLTFTVEYPGKGLRVVKAYRGMLDSINQLFADIIELNPSGDIANIQNISINIYKCGSRKEPMNLCSIFSKYPQEDIVDNLYTISAFPPSIKGLPNRFLAYYKENPPKPSKGTQTNPNPDPPPHDCSSWTDCYRSKRYIMKGTHVNYGNEWNETNWHFDNTTNSVCLDLKGVLVNASVDLTDSYILNGTLYQYDMIEFSGSHYTVNRITITKSDSNVLPPPEGIDAIKSGQISDIFKCKEVITTTTQKSTQTTTEDTTVSHSTPGDTTVSHSTQGHATGSHSTSGDTSDTFSTDGRTTGSHSTAGDTSGSFSTQEDTTGSHSTEGDTTESDVIEGDGIGRVTGEDHNTFETPTEETGTPSSEPQKSGFPVLLIILIIIVILIIIGIATWLLWPKGTNQDASAQAAAKPPESPPAKLDISEAEVTPTPSDTKTIRSN